MNERDLANKLAEIEDQLGKLRKELERESVPEEQQMIGVFDGEFMVTEEGKKYQVPPNYASKSKLVVGDGLRLIEEGPQNLFKHIDKVERQETTGVLIKEDEDWLAVSDEGEFKVLPASISYFEAEVGDRAELLIPANHLEIEVEWAAMTGLVGETDQPEEEAVSQEMTAAEGPLVEETPEVEEEPEEEKSPPETFELR